MGLEVLDEIFRVHREGVSVLWENDMYVFKAKTIKETKIHYRHTSLVDRTFAVVQRCYDTWASSRYA